jgi:hypothetical protein
MAQHAPLVAVDCAPLRTMRQPSAVKSIAMVGRTAIELPGPISYLGSGAASQALQAGLPSVAEADSIDQAAAAMVTGTNCWLAQAHISRGNCKTRCYTRRSTAACSFRRVGCLKKGTA